MKFELGLEFKNLTIISSEIEDGAMNLNHEESVENRIVFFRKNAATSQFAYADQIHETKIIKVQKEGFYRGFDGIISDQNLALGVRTADCVPLIIFEKDSGMVGAVHVSRQNLFDGIIQNLSNCLALKNNTKCFLGPHIRIENYEIGELLANEISKTKFAQFVQDIDGRKHFDLTEAVIYELAQIGIKRDNVEDSGIDTFSDKRFFSNRRKGNKPLKTFWTVAYKKF